MFVTPKTDFWRKTHYGFTVDDGPFYSLLAGGEFEVSVKITGSYANRYDQAGLMIRKNETTWIKAGIEYVDDQYNLSAVVTHQFSDWSVQPLSKDVKDIWIKVIRKLDAVELYYSRNGKDYSLYRLAYFPDHSPVEVGVMAACPDGDGFDIRFEHFSFSHLPDQRRLQWLKDNKS